MLGTTVPELINILERKFKNGDFFANDQICDITFYHDELFDNLTIKAVKKEYKKAGWSGIKFEAKSADMSTFRYKYTFKFTF